jgi:prephenate dehydratase
MTMIAFQGEPGAYSQEAVFQAFGADAATLACNTFEDIFRALKERRADLGMLPIENSTAGSINQSYDLLLDYDFQIVREVTLRVRHALMALPGVTLDDIQRVYSHPAALAQCERFIAGHGWQAVAAYDTAGAAKQLAAARERDAAAIASETAARIYRLPVLASGVEDLPTNSTRFFVIGRGAAERTAGSKTSLVFATQHIPGALHACLGEFASRGINLTKIESRPDRRDPWHYVFYVDLQVHKDDPACQAALTALQDKTSFLLVLGSYPAADEK